jgi:protein-S-isoprenylcysteine O-methyltransferase Ste14
MKLLFQAIFKFLLGVLMIALLLFWPAGTMNYWNAWLLMGLLFIPMFIAGIILWLKNPELLKKRLNVKEKESEQKEVIGMSLIIFVVGFILAGLDFKYGWSNMPIWVVTTASIIFVISYILYAEVLRENTYLSRTIEVQENQKVIDTVLYGIVRHPMYFATTLLFLSFPVVLGSWISFAIFCFFPFVLVKRIKNEEIVLENGLEGYKEYKQKVKYRMIPYVW